MEIKAMEEKKEKENGKKGEMAIAEEGGHEEGRIQVW